MKSDQLIRRIALITGGAAIVGMGTLTAGCSTGTKEEPKTSTTPSATTSAPQLSSTEKAITNPPPVPSIEQRGGMDSTACGPGMSKVNGVCQ